jgi:PBP1b-binding outer membrane lipoprotein LpoB
MSRVLLTSAFVLSLSGCAAEFEDDENQAWADDPTTEPQDSAAQETQETQETEETEEIEEIEDPVFSPIDGDWVVIDSELLRDDCGLRDFVNRGEPGTILILELMDSDNFEMTFTTGGEIVSCELDTENQQYQCDSEDSIDETPRDLGLNASILVNLTSYGSFDSDAQMSLVSDVVLGCDGPDCFWVELLLGTAFPCEMTLSSEVSAE